MKRTLIILTLSVMLVGSYDAVAQRDFTSGSGSSFMDRVYFGGSFGAQFGDITYIDLSPSVGYMINRNLSAGVGITYQYYQYKLLNNYTTHVYGGRVFVRQNFKIMKLPLFIYGEYENLRYEFLEGIAQDGSFITETVWVPGVLIGGGYYQRIGNRAGFMIAVLYNVIYDDKYTPYNNPVIRIGLTF